MKNRIFVAVACLVLAALILLLPLSSGGPGDGSNPNRWPDLLKPPATHTTTGTQPVIRGAVRLYSCEAAEALTQLAAEYTALTGVEVTVLTPEGGSCQTVLQGYLESEEPPTVLCIHSQNQLLQWQDRLLDLTDTAWAAALCNTELGFRLDDRLLGIPMELEAYGLLVNAELLATKGALSRGDFYDMVSLATGVQILKNNSVKAFPAPSLSLQDACYLLQSEDLQAVRTFLDLYLANGSQSGQPREQFLAGISAFCLGGSWEYDALAAAGDTELHVRNLDILPTFTAGAMQYVCGSAWSVNANADQADIEATLSFLSWLVTAGETAAAPVDRLQTLVPFQDAAWYGNQLQRKLQGYMRSEAALLQWKKADRSAINLHQALNAYMEANTDENWAAVSAQLTIMENRKDDKA